MLKFFNFQPNIAKYLALGHLVNGQKHLGVTLSTRRSIDQYRQTDRQTDRKTDKLKDDWVDSQTDGFADRHT